MNMILYSHRIIYPKKKKEEKMLYKKKVSFLPPSIQPTTNKSLCFYIMFFRFVLFLLSMPSKSILLPYTQHFSMLWVFDIKIYDGKITQIYISKAHKRILYAIQQDIEPKIYPFVVFFGGKYILNMLNTKCFVVTEKQ